MRHCIAQLWATPAVQYLCTKIQSSQDSSSLSHFLEDYCKALKRLAEIGAMFMCRDLESEAGNPSVFCTSVQDLMQMALRPLPCSLAEFERQVQVVYESGSSEHTVCDLIDNMNEFSSTFQMKDLASDAKLIDSLTNRPATNETPTQT